jgi:hypothetical protein
MRVPVVAILLLALFAGNALAGCLTIPEDKIVIRFDSKLGDVTFAHLKHANLSITQCTTCHHKHQPGDQAMQPCHDCHKPKAADADPPKTKTALHTRCIGCHEYTAASGVPAGPVKKKCKLCHVK